MTVTIRSFAVQNLVILKVTIRICIPGFVWNKTTKATLKRHTERMWRNIEFV